MDSFQTDIILRNHRELLAGASITLQITAVSFLIALAIGLVVGVARAGSGWAGKLFTPYVEIFRGTPLLIQLFLSTTVCPPSASP